MSRCPGHQVDRRDLEGPPIRDSRLHSHAAVHVDGRGLAGPWRRTELDGVHADARRALAPLPVPSPDELVHVRRVRPADTSGRESSYSYVLFQTLRDTAAPHADVIAKRTPVRRKFGLTPDSRERVIGDAVSDRWFAVLGVRPATGRLLVEGDDNVGGGRAVAVLSHRFWTTRFQADPASLAGRFIRRATVHGRRRRRGWLHGGGRRDASGPVDAADSRSGNLAALVARFELSLAHTHGRVRDRVTTGGVEAALDAVFRTHLEKEILPDIPARLRERFAASTSSFDPPPPAWRSPDVATRRSSICVGAIAACVLLICCLNVANVVRARNDSRMHEFALRRALGASRGRIFRQLAAEGRRSWPSLRLLADWWSRRGPAGCCSGSFPAPQTAFDLAPDIDDRSGHDNSWPRDDVPGGGRTCMALAEGTHRARRRIARQPAMGHPPRIGRVTTGGGARVARDCRPLPDDHAPAPNRTARLRSVVCAGGRAVVSRRHAWRRPSLRRPNASALVWSRPRWLQSVSYVAPWVYADNSGTSMGIVPADYVSKPGEDTLAGTIMAGPDFSTSSGYRFGRAAPISTEDVTGQRPGPARERDVRPQIFRRQVAAWAACSAAPSEGSGDDEIVGMVSDARHYGVRV